MTYSEAEIRELEQAEIDERTSEEAARLCRIGLSLAEYLESQGHSAEDVAYMRAMAKGFLATSVEDQDRILDEATRAVEA